MTSDIVCYKNMKKIIITGPESSGKSSLARSLSGFFRTRFVPEYSRIYLTRLLRPYEESDLLQIAKGQFFLERDYAKRLNGLMICDTSMLVLKVWSDFRFGKTHPWILEQLHGTPRHHYLLCKPDIPWQPDPFRENPQDRDVLFDIYLRELEQLGLSYSIISGERPEERLGLAVRAVKSAPFDFSKGS